MTRRYTNDVASSCRPRDCAGNPRMRAGVERRVRRSLIPSDSMKMCAGFLVVIVDEYLNGDEAEL